MLQVVFQGKIEFFWKEVKERKKRGMGAKGLNHPPTMSF